MAQGAWSIKKGLLSRDLDPCASCPAIAFGDGG
jgi:hypothetical protein